VAGTLNKRSGFNPSPVHLIFVVDRIQLGMRVILFSPLSVPALVQVHKVLNKKFM